MSNSRFEIWGTYQGTRETIDTADRLSEARTLVNEYRTAFGSDWVIGYKDTKPSALNDTLRDIGTGLYRPDRPLF